MLPFSRPEFFAVFARYNESIWPAQLCLYALAIVAVWLAARRSVPASRAVFALLSVFWLWMGVVYHAGFFAAINPAAIAFSLFFGGQAVLFATQAVRRRPSVFSLTSDLRGLAGAGLIVLSLAGYPVLNAIAGHHYPMMPTFGLPCPTTIFTLGLLLLARSAPAYLYVVPIAWSLVGLSAAYVLGVPEDFTLGLALGVAAFVKLADSVGKSGMRYRTPAAALAFILAGMLVGIAASTWWRGTVWMAGLAITSAPILWNTARGITRGRFAADLVAALAIITSLILNQPLVGLVIVLMQSGGEALERFAEGRATDALRSLQEGAPSIVHRMHDGVVTDVAIDLVSRGDTILVRPGEMVPCDGDVMSGTSHLDSSTLTGEPLPRRITSGSPVMSGSINQEGPLVIRVKAMAQESQYARIVALVREAQASKAPLQRIADRYAVFFTPVTLVVCAAAYVASGDWDRVLAVLAIATPCPLILATPVAILGGMNRAARRNILLRNGGALERLGTATAVVFDKTGTITIGRPQVVRVAPTDSVGEGELLRLASSVEQGSSHLLARTLVAEAERRGQLGQAATSVIEAAGRGVEGRVMGRDVTVGARSFVAERHPGARESLERAENGEAVSLRAYVAVDGSLAGFIEYADAVRPGMVDLVTRLESAGIRHVMLISGDSPVNARAVAQQVGIGEWKGDMLPEHKVEVVKRLLDDGESVVMLGDGTNDAPALSTATVGIALASHGRGIATEAADVILLADDPARLIDGIEISRRTMRIARQSIWAGLGLSVVGMMFAATGHIPPIAGAAIQEVVDLGVILNALRASAAPSRHGLW
jgi:heavy metal translocating P-type ATPase